MDPSVYGGLLDVIDHRDSFSPLLSEKGLISNLLLLTTLNIISLRKLASLKKFLVDLTYIWHRFRICMTLSYLVNPFPNKPWFLRVCSTRLLKTLWEKETLLIPSNFSFFHSVFYLFGELSIYSKNEIVICKFFQFGRV